jgi:hypothetical protein
LVAAEDLNPGAGTERSEEMDCVGVALVVASAREAESSLGHDVVVGEVLREDEGRAARARGRVVELMEGWEGEVRLGVVDWFAFCRAGWWGGCVVRTAGKAKTKKERGDAEGSRRTRRSA